ncbi:hypothetical protein K437DRAFT_292866 [Tilletiaria anomala UBC 951]|uniref:Zn(2)-C6 fungal-type domain-containing protein n=1 Tax=Tilletiaria anomala (strain ATCC 24038 / CBS 436.72 / UBC 951) TaxID=1037660 RepID=A0A066WQ60_TILAU|nr:uncharacterized protein K437DRAFT_292866 [Tilletiaria anomala UBC 951]KDN52760.1 hypothetical protein K437DRAFT_292866 [Tilletiaria anomala UBC 951]
MNGLSEEDIHHASLLAEFQASSGPSTPSHPGAAAAAANSKGINHRHHNKSNAGGGGSSSNVNSNTASGSSSHTSHLHPHHHHQHHQLQHQQHDAAAGSGSGSHHHAQPHELGSHNHNHPHAHVAHSHMPYGPSSASSHQGHPRFSSGQGSSQPPPSTGFSLAPAGFHPHIFDNTGGGGAVAGRPNSFNNGYDQSWSHPHTLGPAPPPSASAPADAALQERSNAGAGKKQGNGVETPNRADSGKTSSKKGAKGKGKAAADLAEVETSRNSDVDSDDASALNKQDSISIVIGRPRISNGKRASSGGGGSASQSDRKRRRVVVACDTCRRKKVKCQGLPNASNVCDNCKAYGYKCTFTSEPDRSRGKYEILESKVETLLSALRTVAPHLAQQFQDGDLSIAAPSGSIAGQVDSTDSSQWPMSSNVALPPPPAPPHRSSHSHPGYGASSSSNGDDEAGGGSAGATGTSRESRHGSLEAVAAAAAAILSSGSNGHRGDGAGAASAGGAERGSLAQGGASSSAGPVGGAAGGPGGHSVGRSPATPSGAADGHGSEGRNTDLSIARFLSDGAVGSRPEIKRRDLGPLLPDVEDGRPRYFGRSSTLNYFHGIDSRPPSPNLGSTKWLSAAHAHQLLWPTHHGVAGGGRFGTRTPGTATPTGGLSAMYGLESRSRATSPDRAAGLGSMSANRLRDSHDNTTPSSPVLGGAQQQQQQHDQNILTPCGNKSSLSRHTSAPEQEFKTLPRPRPQPQYPANSKEWVALLRRKNLDAVGRDDVCDNEWFTRYMLPEGDLVLDLFDIFFTRLHPIMPILHRPTMEEDILSGRATHDTAFRGLVFTVLAIASRFTSDTRVRTDEDDASTAGDQFAKASRLYHQVYAASLINVQVLLLSSTFMHSEVGPGVPWTQLGVAIRALQDIGLHQERAYVEFSEFEQELRRRAFWGAFILDALFAVNMGRPVALRVSDCTVRLPKDVTDDAMTDAHARSISLKDKESGTQTVMSGWISLIRLGFIVQDVVLALYSPRWRQEVTQEKHKDYVQNLSKTKQLPEYKDMALLSKRLDEWIADTPAHYRTPQSPYKWQAGILQMGTHDIRLYILKPFLFDPYLRKMLHVQCIDHSKEGLKTIVDLFEDDHLADMVFVMQQGFMSTCTFMITVWHGTAEPDKLAEDELLIEATLRIFASFDVRFLSQIVKKALRLLYNIANRALPSMSSDYADKTKQVLEKLKDVASGLSPPPAQANASFAASTPASRIPFSIASPLPSANAGADVVAATWREGMLPSTFLAGVGDPVDSAGSAMTWAATTGPAPVNGTALSPSVSTSKQQRQSAEASTPNTVREGINGMSTLDTTLSPSGDAPSDIWSTGGGGFDGNEQPRLRQLEDASWGDYFATFLQSLG